MPSAWIILFVNRRNGRVMGADIMSEPSPTVNLNTTAAVPLLRQDGDTFASAHAAAMEALASTAYDWIGPLHTSSSRRPVDFDASSRISAETVSPSLAQLTPSAAHELVTLRETLAYIARRHDCWRYDEGYDAACECPSCLAKRTLSEDTEWRYLGSLPGRITDGRHPRETAMHAAWRKALDSRDPDARLREIMHDETPVTPRDWYVASSIVRWLATNVGSCVLRDAGWVEREWTERDRQRVVELTAEVDRLRKELAAATAGGAK